MTEEPDDESADLDLKMRGLARTCRHVIPFAGVLDASNRAHRKGVALPPQAGPK
ncbi:MAG: hypothetical protein OEQ18_02840 [Gammaproteobacteria bacterium]|nr:hypothetical protein [Gammaproteobacteria bacterium]